MTNIPFKTMIHKRIPKEKFYQHRVLTKGLRDRFISDVEEVFVEYSLAKGSLNLTMDSEVSEILLLCITLKRREFDVGIMEAIARQNPHKLVFQLQFGDLCQLAVYHGKLYRTEWTPASVITLSAQGQSLTEIWHGLIEQIAVSEEQARMAVGLSVNERLALREKILQLEKRIAQTEAAAWREPQPKKSLSFMLDCKTTATCWKASKRAKNIVKRMERRCKAANAKLGLAKNH